MSKFPQWLLFLLLGTISTSCGKFVYSPFMVNIQPEELNKYNLKKIKSRASKFTDEFQVAVLSDTHNYYSELDRAIKSINRKRKKIAFVIVTGDVTNIGMIDEYKQSVKMLKKLKVPFLVGIGNHDYLTNGRKIFKKVFGPRNVSFKFINSNFYLWDNNTWEAGSDAIGLTWIRDELSISQSYFNLVFSHIPPNDRDRFSRNSIEYLDEMLRSNNVTYYINGHNHNPAEGVFGGATHLTVGSVSKKVYQLLTIKADEIKHEKIRF